MKRNTRRILIVMAVLAVAAGAGYFAMPYFFKQGGPAAHAPDAGGHLAIDVGPADHLSATTSTAPATATSQPVAPADQAKALERFNQGIELYTQKKLLAAREALSEAWFSEMLPAEQEAKARQTLEELADKTLFSPTCIDGDPYTLTHTVAAGEVLARLERDYKLHVPTQIINKINGIPQGQMIREGQTLKMILGPFHALVSKSRFTMDIYLQREGLPKVYVKRLMVGLGKNGSTPVGAWQVELGKKGWHTPWNPPPNSPSEKQIPWGEAGYPLGKEGYWIKLLGTDDRTRRENAYGIHGTNDPASIGKEQSLGCIRLKDEDIEMVYFLLYEKWSTVQTRP